MCIPGVDPVTLLGIGLSGAGGYINSKIQNDFIQETNNQNKIAMERERTMRLEEDARQKAMEAMASEEVTRALFEADPASIAEKAEMDAADPENDIVNSLAEYNTPALQGQVQDGKVSETIGKIVADAARRTKGMLSAQSVLNSQNMGLRGVQSALTRLGSEINTIGSNRRGSLGASRLETFVPAATVTPGSSVLGDIFMLGGQAVAGRPRNASRPRLPQRYARVGDVFGSPLTTASNLPAIY